eukprot:NODE_285_length_2302_cov_173.064802_g221_i0.p2 GENE.NODE_285_length_2302_cov_173.064802_g221_i0~~NODE_285_length_2302_cov_173.064802_g221_i0.p2  ORF type:complete len:607 (+),score=207.04 NODE_285_length_2302_cov_173.064802_g221_i0:382-2202(+)
MGKKKGAKGASGKSPTSTDPGSPTSEGPDSPTEDSKASSGAIVNFSKPNIRPGVVDILIENLDLNYKGHDLLNGTTLELNMGHRYGLVGVNGCGKSTLLNVIGMGEIPLPPGCDWFHLQHECAASDKTALEAVLAVDSERRRVEEEVASLEEKVGEGDEEEQNRCNDRLAELYERLDELDAETAEARAAGILNGLGFTPAMQAKPVRAFSGGWRMRISLAQALFMNPTLLVLDEPTNHLDIEAVVWLEHYLMKYNKILLMCCHSADFMNAVCTNVIHMFDKQLNSYKGNYDSYVKVRSELAEHQSKQYQWEQEEIRKMKEYIARFGHGSAKLARQAQSKEKVLAKMERGGLAEAPKRDKIPVFSFPDPPNLPPPVLSFQNVFFRYGDTGPWLYENLNFGLDLESRIALVGPNGAGKTTLQKLMTGELQSREGRVGKHNHLTMGRFAQHFVDQLDLSQNPLEYLATTFPEEKEVDRLRKFLGRFGLSGSHQLQSIGTLSDGQKARVVFAWLAMKAPHIILLDEPTNHLDMDSIDALAVGLNQFDGGVILVSHDMRLIEQVASEIWIVEHRNVKPFEGSIQDYKQMISDRIDSMTEAKTESVARMTRK